MGAAAVAATAAATMKTTTGTASCGLCARRGKADEGTADGREGEPFMRGTPTTRQHWHA